MTYELTIRGNTHSLRKRRRRRRRRRTGRRRRRRRRRRRSRILNVGGVLVLDNP